MITANDIKRSIEENGNIVHLNELYDDLSYYARFYSSYESYQAAIRANLEAHCRESKVYNGNGKDMFCMVLKRTGIYTLREYEFIKEIVENMSTHTEKNKGKILNICKKVLLEERPYL